MLSVGSWRREVQYSVSPGMQIQRATTLYAKTFQPIQFWKNLPINEFLLKQVNSKSCQAERFNV